jgi:RNA polymerase sigma-70 factor (ECF subfamily)
MIIKDDNELVHEVINGNTSSFEPLIERYQKTIFNMVLRMVGDTENAKDITQDIFVKAFEKIETFKFKFRFFSWLYRIAINETINWTKRNPRLDRIQEVNQFLISEQDPEEEGRQSKLLQQGLLELPENYRTLLVLKYYSQLSYEDIAEIKGISVKKVRSRLFTAREQLRKILEINGLF